MRSWDDHRPLEFLPPPVRRRSILPPDGWALVVALTCAGVGIALHLCWPAWAAWLAGVACGLEGLALAAPTRR